MQILAAVRGMSQKGQRFGEGISCSSHCWQIDASLVIVHWQVRHCGLRQSKSAELAIFFANWIGITIDRKDLESVE